ncbi:MAG: ribonuclease R, partial [Alphaproteobacteria bacterium]
GLPNRDELLTFISANGSANRRDIAREFGLRGAQRAALRTILRELEDEGLLEREGRRGVRPAGSLPPVTVIRITHIDADGDPVARPESWDHEEPPPLIYVETKPGRTGAPGIGDRFLARLSAMPDGSYTAQPMRRLPDGPAQITGVFRPSPQGGRISPLERGSRNEFQVAAADTGGADDGALVMATILPGRRGGLSRAAVTEIIGSIHDPHAISLIAIHAAGIPHTFPEAALVQAKETPPFDTDDRTDLRALPLVTIDGADARDFDDAVFAEPDPEDPEGWHIIVAIADVAWYVRPGDPLDREAYLRGNSVYFPDRVVPMLPEALSNGLCSLRPDEDRPCLAAHLYIGPTGRLRRHRFERAIMRSAARLTYEQAQAAHNGQEQLSDIVTQALAPLYEAYAALAGGRRHRGALEIDLPERKVIFGDDHKISQIATQQRLDSHRLVEEFMITANVAAAQALCRRNRPCMYRVHDQPDPDRVEELRTILKEYDLPLARGQVIKPATFNRIIDKVRGEPTERLINQLILRTQSQALYSPDNLGHFGLALRQYAHFTSPIRRYSDLLVHRSLIAALGLGEGGLNDGADFGESGQHISTTERRATVAERNTMDRYLAAYLADHVGATFAGHIAGVARFGLFVTLGDTGADGLVPISRLPGDFYNHDHQRHALIGQRTGRVFRLGDPVEVRLSEADGLTGSLVLDLMEGSVKSPATQARGRGRVTPRVKVKPRGRSKRRARRMQN